MYCMYCGAHLGFAGQKYCTVCGAPVYKKKSGFARYALALLKGLCYYLLMLITSAVFEFVYITVLSMRLRAEGVAVMAPSFTDFSADFWKRFSEGYGWVMLLTYAAIVLFLFVFFRLRRKRLCREIRLCRMQASALPAVLLLGASAQVFTVCAVDYLERLFPAIRGLYGDSAENFDKLFADCPAWLMFLGIAVATPVIEEIIFRGLIFTRMRRVMPPAAAVILSAIAFGAAHGNAVQFAYAFLLGVVMAALLEKYHSLWACIFLHAGFNAASFIYDYVDISKPLTEASLLFVSAGLVLVCLAYFFMSSPVYKKEPLKEIPDEAL